MKNLLTIITFLLSLTITANAQSVAGIKFGTPYATAKQILENRFGESYASDKNGIFYRYITIGGISWNHVGFGFVRDVAGNSYLNDVLLAGKESSLESALHEVENLKISMQNKYDISEYGDEEDTTSTKWFYYGGKNPINEDDALFSIYVRNTEIEKYPQISDNKYFVVLLYGPIGYANSSDDL